MTGIYVLQNTLNKKCYVGSAMNLGGREREHRQKLRRGGHENPHLQASFNKHGEAAFKFWVAEECSKESLIEREQWWIDSFNPAYNIAKVAAAPMAGRKHSSKTRAKMSNARRGKRSGTCRRGHDMLDTSNAYVYNSRRICRACRNVAELKCRAKGVRIKYDLTRSEKRVRA